MFAEVVAEGQSAWTVVDESAAVAIRAALRMRSREAGLRLRTARTDGLVVAARLDAAIWTDDTATMRAKLTPPAS